MMRWRAVTLSALALFAACASAAADEAGCKWQIDLARGWTALRAMDCARCHGRAYDGWAAPSLIAAVRDGSRERFAHFVLEGDTARGMPAYRSQPMVVDELDAIYAYLCARAKGAIGAGAPASAPTPRFDTKRRTPRSKALPSWPCSPVCAAGSSSPQKAERTRAQGH